MASDQDGFPYPGNRTDIDDKKTRSPRFAWGLFIIGILWAAGFWLSTWRDPGRQSWLASVEGPFPLCYTSQSAPVPFRTGDALEVGTRLFAPAFSRVVLGMGKNERMTLFGPADLTQSSTHALSLNQGRFEWDPHGSGEEAPRFETPAGVFMQMPSGVASFEVVDGTVTVTTDAPLKLASWDSKERLLDPGVWRISSAGEAERISNLPAMQDAGQSLVSGEIVDASGQTIPSADAALTRLGEAPKEYATVGLSGLFEARNVPAGQYTLYVKARNFIPSGIPVLTVPEVGEVEVRVPLRPGDSMMGAVVRESDNRPIMDAIVNVDLDTQDWHLLTETERHFATHFLDRTQHRGLFHLEGLVPGGRYSYRIESPGFATQVFKDVDAEEPKVVARMKPESVLRGSVVDGEGKARGFAAVVIDSATDQPGTVAVCDRSGRYRAGGLSSGDYKVRVKGTPVTAQVRLGEQETKNQRLTLPAGNAGSTNDAS